MPCHCVPDSRPVVPSFAPPPPSSPVVPQSFAPAPPRSAPIVPGIPLAAVPVRTPTPIFIMPAQPHIRPLKPTSRTVDPVPSRGRPAPRAFIAEVPKQSKKQRRAPLASQTVQLFIEPVSNKGSVRANPRPISVQRSAAVTLARQRLRLGPSAEDLF